MKFWGYKRPDGKVGIRNHVVVMPGVVCGQVAAQRIVKNTLGTTFLFNPKGCGQCIDDSARTLETLSGLISNPNVYAALIVGLGCETLQEERYLEAVKRKAPWKEVHYISIQEAGGLGTTVKLGSAIAQKLVAEASKCRREPCAVSDLMLGLECGGSDPTSGISANTVLGVVSDRIVDLGGTTVISETSEAIGGESILKDRGKTPEIGRKIYDAVLWREKAYLNASGEDIRDTNPSPGNIRSGLTTLEEKSMGCINKSGSQPFTGCFSSSETVDCKGAVFMETSAYDPISTTAEAAGGCQIIAFTTGMGNPMGNPIAPVFKITGNHDTFTRLEDLIDFDTSANMTGEAATQYLADKMLGEILDICSGKLTKAEMNGADVVDIDQFYLAP